MSLFKRKQDTVVDEEQLSSPHQATELMSPAFAAMRESVRVEEMLSPGELHILGETYASAWNDIGRIIDSTNFGKVLSDFEDDIPMPLKPGEVVLTTRRRLNKEHQDAVLLAILSARVAAKPTDDEEYTPLLFTSGITAPYDDSEAAQQSAKILESIQSRAALLLPEFRKVERSIDQTIELAKRAINSSDVDNFVSWLRDTATDEELKDILRHTMAIIAQDVHDPERGKLQGVIMEKLAGDGTLEIKEKYADALLHEDGEFAEELETINFTIEAFRQRQIEISVRDIILTVPQELWTKDLRTSFSRFKSDRAAEIFKEIKALTLPFYQRSRRSPTLEELKRLERALILTPQDIAEENRVGRRIKKPRASVSNDYADTHAVGIEKVKQAKITRARLSKDARTRNINIEEGDEKEIIEELIEEFVNEYKLDGSQRLVATVDIKKMITALKTNPTGNRGVTKLNDVRPYRDGKNQSHTVWRLNPVFYNGLSVSEAGKDIRVIYTVSNGQVNIIGIYSHDDYLKRISDSR